ncbi:hypothetical protein KC921_00935 [Candidatus Woesebacteria bacterium]|nr:hypothetical protein [Candidatus Woesebacteria bacterium]
MLNELRTHWRSYTALIIGLLSILLLYLYVWPNVWLIRYISLAMGIFYFTWGILAHTKSKHLTKRVAMEYAAVAILGVLLLWMVTI